MKALDRRNLLIGLLAGISACLILILVLNVLPKAAHAAPGAGGPRWQICLSHEKHVGRGYQYIAYAIDQNTGEVYGLKMVQSVRPTAYEWRKLTAGRPG